MNEYAIIRGFDVSVFFGLIVRYSVFAKKNTFFHILVWVGLLALAFGSVYLTISNDEMVYMSSFLLLAFVFWFLSASSEYKLQMPD